MRTDIVHEHWGRNGFPYKTKDRVQDQKREYDPNDDYGFIPSHLFHHRCTAGNDFPHSRQNTFERDVMNPQDGHILWDPKPAICGFSLIPRADALKFLNERVTKVGSVRKREQNGRKTGSMTNPISIGCAGAVAEGVNV